MLVLSFFSAIILPICIIHGCGQTNAVVRASPAPVNNGTVDIRGRNADKRRTGGWKASPFTTVNEVAERLAFSAIGVNMASYLVLEARPSLPTAATCVTNWMGAAYGLTLLGAFLVDAYLGRFRTIVVFSLVYAVV